MGSDGKCKYIFKCRGCGEEHRDSAYQDGSGGIAKVHDGWEKRRCGCGGSFELYRSEVWYGDSGTVHEDPRRYFASATYHDALVSRCLSEDSELRERAEAELRRAFPGGRPQDPKGAPLA